MSVNDTFIEDPDLAKVETALKRAAIKAREIAKDTGTPLVLYKNGQIVLETIEDEKNRAANE
jgi:hypothetical protein